MKIKFLIILFVLYGCQTKTLKSFSKSSKIEKPLQISVENVNKRFFVGDFDNDKFNDTAFVNYKWNFETGEIECRKNDCDINVEFKNNIPKISFSQSLGIVVAKSEDINNDNKNEILIFSRTHEGWWNKISIWTFKDNTWKKIGETDAYLSHDKDYENRIIKEKGQYYLIGEDKWNEDEKGNFKKVKVKL